MLQPHRLTIQLSVILLLLTSSHQDPVLAQKKKPPTGGRLAVVVDERLSALRSAPQLTGRLVRRLGRGRLVAIRAARINPDGIGFFLVNVTTRTHGWIQREAVVSPSQKGDDQRLLRLINSSEGFDRISRARVFLDHFQRSALRPEVLLVLGDASEELAARLSRDAARRMNEKSREAPESSYFLNYTGLDRYNRQRVGFVFDESTKRFHYDGAAWRELVRQYPTTREAGEARKRLTELARLVR